MFGTGERVTGNQGGADRSGRESLFSGMKVSGMTDQILH